MQSVKKTSSVLIIQDLKDIFDPTILFLDGALKDGILSFQVLYLSHKLLFGGLDLDVVSTLLGDVAGYATRAWSRLLAITLSHQLFTVLIVFKVFCLTFARAFLQLVHAF